MKIVFTALKYLPHIGGIEIYIHELAQHLIKNGWTVTIVSADVDCVTIVREIIDHEKVIRIPASEIAKFPIIKKRHIHIIEDEIKDADVVHMNVCKLLVDYFVNKKKQYKYKLVMSSHGWLYHTSKNKNMKNLYFKLVVSRNARYFDTIINVSKQDQIIAEKFGVKNTIIITNGVDIYKYANENRKEKFENIFLYWGRIAINKGIFESIVKLSDYHSDFVFNIIGVCEDEEYMYKLVSYINEKSMGNKIRFLGSLVDGQIKEYINQADIILMPSLHEGFGMTLTECLLSNRPIIANTNESYKYILEYCGASRYLFDYLDPNSKIENKIKELCENIVSPQNVNEFSVDNMIKRTMDIYKS